MRNDSSVAECCWFGLCDRRNSCSAMFDSETIANTVALSLGLVSPWAATDGVAP